MEFIKWNFLVRKNGSSEGVLCIICIFIMKEIIFFSGAAPCCCENFLHAQQTVIGAFLYAET